MEDWELDLLDEHLAHWYDLEELTEIYESDRPAMAIAAELATFDLAFFCRYYLSQYFPDSPAECHWDLYADLQWAATADMGMTNHLAESLPRGFGKSTTIAVGFPCWVIVGQDPLNRRGRYRRPLKHYILLIKDAFDQAKLELGAVKDELEFNEKIRRDFGEFKGDDTWAKAEFSTSNGVRVEALGTGQKVRGRRYKQYRPDLIIGDDLENMRTVKSPTQRADVKHWWSAAVEKAIDPKTGTLINIGTMIHYDCLQAWVVARPGVRGRIYKALIEEASRQDLWDQWEGLLTNLEDPDRERTALNFYEGNKADMDMGAVVSWPERFSYYALRMMKLGEKTIKGNRIRTFAAEMQNEPISDEDRLFQKIQFFFIEHDRGHTYLVPYGAGERVNLHSCKLVGSCDPSLGESHRGDYSALVDILVAPSGRMYCVWADIARRHPDRIIDAIRQRAQYWAQQRMFYSVYGIESNQFQKMFAGKTGLDLLKSGIRLPIQEINSTHYKEARIDSLQPDLYNGYLLLYKEQHADGPEELEVLYEQLWAYPRGDYVDGPDALEMARSLAAVSVAGRGYDVSALTRRSDSLAVSGGSTRGDPFS